MQPLFQIRTDVDNIAAQGCSNRGSVITATAVGTILRDLTLLTHTHHIYSSIQQIKGADNTMADTTSILTHLSDRISLQYFALTFPQKNPWRLLTLLSGCSWWLTSILKGISATIFQKDTAAWRQWRILCRWLGIPSDLQGVEDPIPLLNIFGKRVHVGLIAALVIPINKWSVEQHLCSIGQIFTAMGAIDPQKNKFRKTQFLPGTATRDL